MRKPLQLVSSTLICLLIFWCGSTYAHHVLGRPAYSLNEDSNTPPGAHIETRSGNYEINYMVYPAFPRPGETGRLNLYVSRIDDGRPYQGKVTFTVRGDSWFGSSQKTLGTQSPDDNVFRQKFTFDDKGNYIIQARFEAEGKSHRIDFPLAVGPAWLVSPTTIVVVVLMLAVIGFSLLYRKRILRTKIRTARESNAQDV